MKRSLLVLGTLGALLPVGALAGAQQATAAAKPQEVTFTAPVPCGAVCAYWVEGNCVGCNPDGTARKTAESAGHRGPIFNPAGVVDTCDKPFPPGSFDTLQVGTPPPGAEGLDFKLFPLSDWDTFICAYRGPNADEFRADPTDTQVRWRVVAQGAHAADDPCANSTGVDALPIGCFEHATAAVSQGTRYMLIAYNWSDIPTADGQWYWVCPNVCEGSAPQATTVNAAPGGKGATPPKGAARSSLSTRPARPVSGPASAVAAVAPPAAAPAVGAPATLAARTAADRTNPFPGGGDMSAMRLLALAAAVIGGWALAGAAGWGAWAGLKRLRR